MRNGRRNDNGRRLTDRQLVTVTAAVDAANVVAQMEREIASMREQWGKCFPAPAARDDDNGRAAFYAMKGIGSNGKV